MTFANIDILLVLGLLVFAVSVRLILKGFSSSDRKKKEKPE